MPSRKVVGAAPLITGMLLAFRAASTIVQGGLSLWSVLGFVGSCAAIVVGLGILLEWNAFEQDRTERTHSSAALIGLAAVAFVVGAAIAIA